MFISKLSIYTNRVIEKEQPTWADVEDAIRRLDGDDCTEVIIGLGKDREPFMGVGGGEDGQYAVSVNAEDKIFILIDSAKPDDEVICLMWGGQDGDFPAQYVIDFETTFRAVRTFAETGERDASLQWWHDSDVSTA